MADNRALWLKRAKDRGIVVQRGEPTDSIKAKVQDAAAAKHQGLRKL